MNELELREKIKVESAKVSNLFADRFMQTSITLASAINYRNRLIEALHKALSAYGLSVNVTYDHHRLTFPILTERLENSLITATLTTWVTVFNSEGTVLCSMPVGIHRTGLTAVDCVGIDLIKL